MTTHKKLLRGLKRLRWYYCFFFNFYFFKRISYFSNLYQLIFFIIWLFK
jgi:hypothetical protein